MEGIIVMRIFIPTRGRRHQQITRRFFPQAEMVVPACEADLWEERIVVPDCFNFSQIRQYIAKLPGDPNHVVIDDDLYFYQRVNGHLETMTDVSEMIKWLQDQFDEGYVHGGVSAREGNNWTEEDSKENGRCMRFHFYHAPTIIGEGLKFTDVKCRQDFHMTLSLLELGYPNIVSYKFAQNQPGSAKKGGCDWYRTPEMMKEEAEKLRVLHPDVVRVVEKTTKGSWGGGTRTDVRIQWQKSFCSKEQERKLC